METGYPAVPAAESVMQDESGREFIRLGIGVRKDHGGGNLLVH